ERGCQAGGTDGRWCRGLLPSTAVADPPQSACHLHAHRDFFHTRLLAFRDTNFQDTVLELGGGLLPLRAGGQGHGAGERPIVEFPVYIVAIIPNNLTNQKIVEL